MSPTTDASLLRRLEHAPGDPAAWERFVRVYGPLIRDWCRRWDLQGTDADDLTRDVLVRLLQRVAAFKYDPAKSFRAYLKTVARYVWLDFVRARPLLRGGTPDAAADLDTLPAGQSPSDVLKDRYDRELLDHAIVLVAARVEPATWKAFRLTTFDGLSGGEVARRTGLPVASVWKARSNVARMLRGTIGRLGGPPGGG